MARPLRTRYEDDLALFPDTWHKRALALVVVFLVAFPFLADARWLTVGNLALLSIVGAVALMILTGFAGQISLGHAAFLALGAYTTAVLGHHAHLPFWLALPAGGLVAAVVGLAVGPFALRLEGLYLAIVTLGLIFLVNHVLLSLPQWTGGVSGTPVPMHTGFTAAEAADDFGNFGESLTLGPLTVVFEQKLYFVFLLITSLTVLFAVRLRRSNTGRAMMAVRDHDLAAAALGVPPSAVKIRAFALSSFFAGLAGGMFACQQQYITIEPPFDLTLSVQYIAMIVLGGMGTVFGAVAGALAYVILTPLAEATARHLPLLRDLTSAQQSTLLFSVLVIAVLLFEPLGLYGLWLRTKRYFAAWPFRY